MRRHWSDALASRSRRPPRLPGGLAARRYGLRSASEEAALAFPVLFETALPALTAAMAPSPRAKSRHPSRIHEDRTTVVVAGGGLGGVAAAHAAAERGAVLGLAEETARLAGQLTRPAARDRDRRRRARLAARERRGHVRRDLPATHDDRAVSGR